MEADTKFGGMKLHNLEFFDSSLKAGWLKRYVRSNSNWCGIPDDFELYDITFGTNFIDRILEMTLNPFLKDVLNSIKLLSKKEGFIYSDSTLLTPLCYNPDLKLQIKREWFEKRIYSIWDVLNTDRQPHSLQDFEDRYHLKTNMVTSPLSSGSILDIKIYLCMTLITLLTHILMFSYPWTKRVWQIFIK